MSWDKNVTIRCDITACIEFCATGKSHVSSARLTAAEEHGYGIARANGKCYDICPKCIKKFDEHTTIKGNENTRGNIDIFTMMDTDSENE